MNPSRNSMACNVLPNSVVNPSYFWDNEHGQFLILGGIMRKSDFLHEVRQRIAQKPPDMLRRLFLEFARYIPPAMHEETLSLLNQNDVIVIQKPSIDLLSAVRQICEGTCSGVYDLSWEHDEGYYSGYYSEDEVLVDENGLGEEINLVLETSMRYVDEKRYMEAFQAFDELFALEIPMEHYDDIDIKMLFENDVIPLDRMEVLRYYAYAAMMALKGEVRVEKMYDILCLASYGVTLQEIMQIGVGEIPEQEECIRHWVLFLMEQKLPPYKMHRLERTLIDAITFSGGIQALHAFVLEHGVEYQTAYIELIEAYTKEKQYEQAIAVALDGLSKIEGINSRRTQVADLLLDISNLTDDMKLRREAIWEGFKSSVDLSHFMNLYHLQDEGLTAQAIHYVDNNRQKGSSDYIYIHFLNRDYDLAWCICKEDKGSLGWSASEKGRGLPLFVALLSNENAITSCAKKLIEYTFPHSTIFENFIQTLALSMRDPSETELQNYYDWCISEISGRVDAIVTNQHRGSYCKASALIVSMAEALRAKGDGIGARRFIMEYKEKYPRHSAFRACLREDTQLAAFGRLF